MSGSPIYLPGFGADIGNAFASAGALAGHIINPNREIQDKIKAMLVDPTEIPKFANAYAANPAAFDGNEKVFGKENLAILKKTVGDPSFIMNRTIGQLGLSSLQNPTTATEAAATATGTQTPVQRTIQQNSATGGAINNQIAGNTLEDQNKLKAAIAGMDPDVQTKMYGDAAFQKLTGMVPEEATLLTDRVAKLKRQNAITSQADDWMKTNPKMGIKEIAAGIRDGSIDPTTAAGLTQHATLGPTIQQAITEQDRQDDMLTQHKNALESQQIGINATGDRQDKSIEAQRVAAEERNKIQGTRQLRDMTNNFTGKILSIVKMQQSGGVDKDRMKTEVVPVLQTQLDQLYDAQGKGPAPKITLEDDTKWYQPAKPLLHFVDPTSGKPVVIDGDNLNKLAKGEIAPAAPATTSNAVDSARTKLPDNISQQAYDMIKSGKGTLEQLMSPEVKNLTAAQKEAIKAALGSK